VYNVYVYFLIFKQIDLNYS